MYIRMFVYVLVSGWTDRFEVIDRRRLRGGDDVVYMDVRS